MWVAICRFDDLQAELDYNLLENQTDDSFKKKVSTNEDCQVSLINMWQSIPNFNEESLKERVKNLQKTPSDKRIEKEVSLTYLYNFCKDFVTKYEDENLKRGNLTLNFPQQYESDEWKIGVKT